RGDGRRYGRRAECLADSGVAVALAGRSGEVDVLDLGCGQGAVEDLDFVDLAVPGGGLGPAHGPQANGKAIRVERRSPEQRAGGVDLAVQVQDHVCAVKSDGRVIPRVGRNRGGAVEIGGVSGAVVEAQLPRGGAGENQSESALNAGKAV